MAMDLHGILNQNEYYTNHYFTTIFEENASDTIVNWRQAAKDNETATPWATFRDTSKNYYNDINVFNSGYLCIIKKLGYR